MFHHLINKVSHIAIDHSNSFIGALPSSLHFDNVITAFLLVVVRVVDFLNFADSAVVVVVSPVSVESC